MLRKLLVTSIVSSLLAQVSAQGLVPPQADQCIDPTGYEKCSQNSTLAYLNCNNSCGELENATCVSGCDTLMSGSAIGCYLQSCWNQWASCYVQDEIVLYYQLGVQNLPTQPSFPYFPPGDNIGGACQCNLGKLQLLSRLANQTANPCTRGSDCDCCYTSALISAYYDICPTGNVDYVGFQFAQNNASAASAASSNKCEILRASSNPGQACAKFGSAPFGAKEYLDPAALPSGWPGSGLSNNPGSVTALATSGSTVLSLPQWTTTITYAAYTPVTVGVGSAGGNPTLSGETTFVESATWTFGPSGAGSGAGASATGSSASQTSGSTASATGSAAAPTSSKSAASSSSPVGLWWLPVVFGATLFL